MSYLRFLCRFVHSCVQHILTMRVPRLMSIRYRNCLLFVGAWVHPLVFDGVRCSSRPPGFIPWILMGSVELSVKSSQRLTDITMAMWKRNNGRQDSTQKTRYWATRTPQKKQVNWGDILVFCNPIYWRDILVFCIPTYWGDILVFCNPTCIWWSWYFVLSNTWKSLIERKKHA
jgi:hypothetical protein